MLKQRTTTDLRLSQVDGLRAIAIFWVAIYHYAYFWTPAGKGDNLVPYGEALAWIPLADVGFLGVYLFFIVSGFVIALSLQRSASIMSFWINRLIRLWPTLIICGTATFILTTLFGPPQLVRSTAEYVISLTFIPPPHVGKALGIGDLQWLDGAYWSLWTEVRFYIVAGFLYFIAKDRFVLLWLLFSTACSAILLIGLASSGSADAVARLLFAEHQPYFSAGIALACLRAEQNIKLAKAMLFISVVQAAAYAIFGTAGMSLTELIGITIVFTLAAPVMLACGPVPILSTPLLVQIGVASYAYYLLHQNAGFALLVALGGPTTTGGIMIMIGTQMGLLVFSVFLTRRIEEPLRRWLRKVTARAGQAKQPQIQ